MDHVLAVFAVWLLWNLLVMLLTTPDWFPWVIAIALGIGFELLIDPSYWWLGVGIAGAAGVLVLIGDLLLITTDAIRKGLLLRVGRRG